MSGMTWGELKRRVEEAGIGDATVIDAVDLYSPSAGEELEIGVDANGAIVQTMPAGPDDPIWQEMAREHRLVDRLRGLIDSWRSTRFIHDNPAFAAGYVAACITSAAELESILD